MPTPRTALLFALLPIALTLLKPSAAIAQSHFRTIGPSIVHGVSGDGTTLIGADGTPQPGSTRAMRWREGMGIQHLGGIPEPFNGQSFAYATSADGEVVVGRSYYAPGNYSEAFLWSPATGMIGLGDLPGGIFSSSARGVSADGSVVVGLSVGADGFEAFRWTPQTGIVGLGGFPGNPHPGSYARAVSSDGAVVVGYAERVSTGRTEAFRWTAEGGMVGLGLAGNLRTDAAAVSADGAVIVGEATRYSPTGTPVAEAFRWTQETGMVLLGHLPESPNNSWAVGVSGDGSVVVGNGGGPWVWTPDHGMRWLYYILVQDFGVDLTGFSLGQVRGISADGRTIVGTGYRFATGHNEGWIAVIPAPPTALAGLLAAWALAPRRRPR